MYRYLIILLMVFAVSCQQNKKTDDKQNAAAPEIVEVKFQVEGMHCTDCENSIVKGVNELEGIESVVASYTDSVAVVKFDKSKTTVQEITKQIEKRGYKVKGES